MEILKNKNERGFTLIELLVSLFAFGMIILAITGVSQAVIKSQRKAFALQEVQESGRFILESLDKEIRMSKIETGGDGETTTSILNITNPNGDNVTYTFDGVNKKLTREIDPAGPIGLYAPEDISPTNLDLTGSFYIRKDISPTATPKALVTIMMRIESPSQRVEEESIIYLQSTISSRSWEY